METLYITIIGGTSVIIGYFVKQLINKVDKTYEAVIQNNNLQTVTNINMARDIKEVKDALIDLKEDFSKHIEEYHT